MKPIQGFGVSKVVASDNPDFKPGDLVSGITGWEEYSLIQKPEQLRRVQQDDIPLSFNLGLLGMPGLTAYAGFYEVAKLDKFSIASASSTIIDYLSITLQMMVITQFDIYLTINRYFPEGIDIYFDNVGGDMLDAALLNMRISGRIAVCGMVSLHSLSDPQGIRNLFNLLTKRIRMQGFLQSDYLHLYPKFLEHVINNYRQGKLVYIEDMNEGLESAPAALAGLFSGKNVGKQVIRVAYE
ncbi:hypothetical protein GH714_000296 [Hevea brasiliensis]|uniref:Enoyl reductase (ER) domain-containing protein n=1 Tax=Hevea brasiliensis TaxID=3981 RepID=A0A6A6KSS6_HEVBR|nr:hypothetical protein GH714_000296 [Hevea brasiliensis]